MADIRSTVSKREVFVWKPVHEMHFIREVLLLEPFSHKPGSKERGQAWTQVADNLNMTANPKFKVTQRSVREKFEKMLTNFKKNEAYERRASGIEGEAYDEINHGLMDITERIDENERLWAGQKEEVDKKTELEAKQAQEVRRKATERLGKTMERVGQNEPRKRRASTEAFAIINESLKAKKQQVDRDLEIKSREVEIRAQELEEARNQAAEARNFQQMQIQWMQQLQQQQQQLMQNQQQQNMHMMECMMEMMKHVKQ